MPIYEYRCSSCGAHKEHLQKVSDPKLTVCPECGKETYEKQLTAAGFQLKGSGWYVTDFRNNGSTTSAKTTDGKSGSAETGAAKTESKDSGSSTPASSSEGKGSSAAAEPAASTPAVPASAPAGSAGSGS
jgi:putative FmdB family regulatory protein